MTVFMAVTVESEMSHFGGSTALIIAGGLEGVDESTGALFVLLESCLRLHEPENDKIYKKIRFMEFRVQLLKSNQYNLICSGPFCHPIRI